jgi:hypothetical protein
MQCQLHQFDAARRGRQPEALRPVHLLVTAIEEGRDPSSMSGILAGTACRLLLA